MVCVLLLSWGMMSRLDSFTKTLSIATSLAAFALLGCTAQSEVDTTADGTATYKDSQTDHDGQAKQPDRPEAQSISVEIDVEGSGDLSGVDTTCVDGLGGSFTGLFEGEGHIDGDGAYAAGLASADAEFLTPSGCTIPELQINALSDVVVRATLEATTTSCQHYCSAKARSSAEADCGADASAAQCRSSAEAAYESSCTTSCTTSGYSIVAETRLSAQALAELNARAITGAAIGEIHAELTFDHVEDANGDEVSESP